MMLPAVRMAVTARGSSATAFEIWAQTLCRHNVCQPTYKEAGKSVGGFAGVVAQAVDAVILTAMDIGQGQYSQI